MPWLMMVMMVGAGLTWKGFPANCFLLMMLMPSQAGEMVGSLWVILEFLGLYTGGD